VHLVGPYYANISRCTVHRTSKDKIYTHIEMRIFNNSEILDFLRCYAVLTGGYRRFGTPKIAQKQTT